MYNMNNMIKSAKFPWIRSKSKTPEGNGVNTGSGQRVYHAGGSSGIVLNKNGVPRRIRVTPGARKAMQSEYDPLLDGMSYYGRHHLKLPYVYDPAKWYNPISFKSPRLNVTEMERLARTAGLHRDRPIYARGDDARIFHTTGTRVKLTMGDDGTVYQSYPGYWKAPLVGVGLGADAMGVAILAADWLNSDDEPQPASAPAKPGESAPAEPGESVPAKPGESVPATKSAPAPAPAKPGESAPAKPAPAKSGEPAPAKPGESVPATKSAPAPAKPASGTGNGGNNPTAGSKKPGTQPQTATSGLWDQINNSDIVKWMKANPGTTLGVGLGVPAALLAINSLLDDDDEEEEEIRKMRKRMRRLGY